MKRIIFLLLLFCSNAFGALTDIKFGRYQIADSQWNVSACLNTTTCQIYSKQPGTMYKIPWFNGTWSWQSGQYVQFGLTGNASYPYEGKVYNSNGTLAGTIGTGKIVNMGPDYFFFVGNDNNTGQLFSGSSGMSTTSGVSWTGALNPTIQQADTYANATYSTVPLSSGQTATSTPSNAAPPPPVPTAIYNNSSGVYVTRAIPTSNNSPSNEGPSNAFDNNPYTKYLNFDKQNAGVTIQLNAGRVVTSFKLTTANDAVERDPTSYKLYGSNDGSTWTLIQQGSLSLSDNRFSVSSDIAVTNSTAYVYYFMIFPSIKNDAGNSVQIAEITYFYDANNTTTSTATSNSIVDPTTAASAPALCCGGSAAAFNSSAANTAKVLAFVNRTTADSQVHIEQIGTQNVVEVNQSGTRNNYVEYYGNGLSNDINITQTGNATTQANYIDLRVVGNFNSIDLQQTSTGGTKGIFADVSGNNNSLLVQQKDSGSHYAEITLSGGNKNVDVLQQGSASHMAKVNLSGTPTDLSLTQSGSTQNYYSITHNCTTVGGCAKITVTQGQ
jgi:hypothetical protein